MVFLGKIVVYGVLSRILQPTGLRVFCAIFWGKKCARANLYTFRMSDPPTPIRLQFCVLFGKKLHTKNCQFTKDGFTKCPLFIFQHLTPRLRQNVDICFNLQYQIIQIHPPALTHSLTDLTRHITQVCWCGAEFLCKVCIETFQISCLQSLHLGFLKGDRI